METKQRIDTPEQNPDLITKEPGSHPVGTGLGAAAGGAAGTGAVIAAGAVLGSVGEACEAADLKPGTRIRVTTRGADRSVANRIEALDRNVEFATL